MFKRILVPTDGSPYSSTALEYAIFLANTFKNALICGLSVMDVKMLAGPFLHDLGVSIGLGPFDSYQPRVRQMLKDKGNLALNAAQDRCKEAGIEYEGHLVEGLVSREILKRAQECDLVVMGKLGEHADWRSTLLGHNIETVTRSSNHPVLVTPSVFKDFRKALIAYDGSSHAYNAMHDSGELAAKLDIPLVVFTSHSDIETAQATSETAKRYLLRYGIDVETVFRTEYPEVSILEVTEKESCDLIIMGAYGHSRIQELILGSTTEQVIRRSECPILLHR